ncbi:MAG TPA: hypothetical protein VK968_11565, partial [Roseimicrobium sp.]|nr:hypothetical protein [Roseimicrobium sp.]
MMRRKTLLLAVTFMTLNALSSPIWAKFRITDQPAPIDRLLANVTAYVKAHPEEAAGYYTLGRVYALAYAQDGAQIEVTPAEKDGALPTFDPHRSVQDASRGADEPLTDGKRIHLAKSLENYQKATELEPKNGLYWLGYGWMLQQAHLHKVVDAKGRSWRT